MLTDVHSFSHWKTKCVDITKVLLVPSEDTWAHSYYLHSTCCCRLQFYLLDCHLRHSKVKLTSRMILLHVTKSRAPMPILWYIHTGVIWSPERLKTLPYAPQSTFGYISKTMYVTVPVKVLAICWQQESTWWDCPHLVSAISCHASALLNLCL